MMKNWQGSFGIVLTPFAKDGSVDLYEAERQLAALCRTDVAGLIICGSTGEFPFLSERETADLFALAAQVVQSRKILVGGATLSCAKHTIERLEALHKLGYDGALIAPPTYFRYEDAEIAAYYRALAAADTGVPIVAYQISAFTSTIGPETFETLLDCPQVEGLKNSDQNMRIIAHQVRTRDAHRPDFAVLTGTEDAFLPSLVAGCSGGFTAFGALLPDHMAAIYRAYAAGDLATSQACQASLLPLMNLCASLPFPLGYKVLGELLGLQNAHYPQSLSPALRTKMQAVRGQLSTELERLNTCPESRTEDAV